VFNQPVETNIVDTMKKIALAAMADKEHIQQMSTNADGLLKIVEKQ
jgi:hypothetical protein